MHYDDLTAGEELEPRVIDAVRPADIKLIAAVLEDPYRPHFDDRFADDLDYPNLLNQGPVNFAYMLQTVTRHLEKPSDVRSFDVQFKDMVFAGDRVVGHAVVESKRIENGTGIVEFGVSLEKEDGTIAVEGTVTTRVPRS